jgi:hypothetical protein
VHINIDSIMTNGIVALPIIIGLVQIFKNLVPEKWWKFSPLVSIGVAVLITWVTEDYNTKDMLLSSFVLGLTSCGLYSGVKTLATDSRKDELKDNVL